MCGIVQERIDFVISEKGSNKYTVIEFRGNHDTNSFVCHILTAFSIKFYY